MSNLNQFKMNPKATHPGKLLLKKMNDEGYTQRDFAVILGIAHSHLNQILQCEKNINTNIAVSLEALGMETARYWMDKQVQYLIEELKSKSSTVKKTDQIKEWNIYNNLVPIKYFKKQGVLGDDISSNLNAINSIYQIKNSSDLEGLVNNFTHVRYRKSDAFTEDKKNILAWEKMAEYKVSQIKVEKYNPNRIGELVKELNKIFYQNVDTLTKSAKVLKKFGIRFATLDRPPKTPVDGRSFMYGGVPSICLTLKYKRLDNFAYTLMHEIGHVYHHLTMDDKYTGFYSDYKEEDYLKEEIEADKFASDNLIDPQAWDNFYYDFSFTDSSIRDFAKSQKVHPAIVRGRICYKHNEFYRRRSSINAENVTAGISKPTW